MIKILKYLINIDKNLEEMYKKLHGYLYIIIESKSEETLIIDNMIKTLALIIHIRDTDPKKLNLLESHMKSIDVFRSSIENISHDYNVCLNLILNDYKKYRDIHNEYVNKIKEIKDRYSFISYLFKDGRYSKTLEI